MRRPAPILRRTCLPRSFHCGSSYPNAVSPFGCPIPQWLPGLRRCRGCPPARRRTWIPALNRSLQLPFRLPPAAPAAGGRGLTGMGRSPTAGYHHDRPLPKQLGLPESVTVGNSTQPVRPPPTRLRWSPPKRQLGGRPEVDPGWDYAASSLAEGGPLCAEDPPWPIFFFSGTSSPLPEETPRTVGIHAPRIQQGLARDLDNHENAEL